MAKTQYKRFSSTSFIFVSCLRAFSYYPSISPEKCPKYLSVFRCVFVVRHHHHFCTENAMHFFFVLAPCRPNDIKFEIRVHLPSFLVCFASCAKQMHYTNISNQGLFSNLPSWVQLKLIWSESEANSREEFLRKLLRKNSEFSIIFQECSLANHNLFEILFFFFHFFLQWNRATDTWIIKIETK